MKVLLLNPPLNLQIKDRPIVNSLFFNSPPLGLGYLAAVLEKKGHTIGILDATVERLTVETTLKRITEFNPAILGLTVTTISYSQAKIIAKKIKKVFPEIKIIAGGAHISSNYREVIQENCFDLGIIGEGEETLLEVIEFIQKGQQHFGAIKGIAYKKNDEIIFTGRRSFIQNLDSLPYPARHLFPMNLYRPQPNDQKKQPKLSMISSRGCPYQCIYCDKNVFGSQYRSFSAQYIVSEMKHLINEYHAKDIAFVDSTFTFNEERVFNIAKEIKKEKLNVSWTCTVRANIITYNLLKEMKEAGCWRVRIGMESGNDNVLKFIKKGITKKNIVNAAQWAAKLRLQPKGFFMIGHLIDDNSTIKETINFAKSLPLKDITVQYNTVLKNTPQSILYKQHGKLNSTDIQLSTYWEPHFIPYKIKKDELERLFHKFYRKFYLRPAILWRHAITLLSFEDLKKYWTNLSLLLGLFIKKRK